MGEPTKMRQVVIENPVLNSPYAEPRRQASAATGGLRTT
jgi:hypothetical protein